MLFRKTRMKHRIRNNRCPFCNLDFELVELFDGTQWSPTKMCPSRCYALKFGTQIADHILRVTQQPIANNGAPIPIPESSLRYRGEILSELEDEL